MPLLQRLQKLRLFKKNPPSMRRMKSPISNYTLTTSNLMSLKSATRCSSAAKRIVLQTTSTTSKPRISHTSLNTSTTTKKPPGLQEFQKNCKIPHTKRSANLWVTYFILNGKKTPPSNNVNLKRTNILQSNFMVKRAGPSVRTSVKSPIVIPAGLTALLKPITN